MSNKRWEKRSVVGAKDLRVRSSSMEELSNGRSHVADPSPCAHEAVRVTQDNQ